MQLLTNYVTSEHVNQSSVDHSSITWTLLCGLVGSDGQLCTRVSPLGKYLPYYPLNHLRRYVLILNATSLVYSNIPSVGGWWTDIIGRTFRDSNNYNLTTLKYQQYNEYVCNDLCAHVRSPPLVRT